DRWQRGFGKNAMTSRGGKFAVLRHHHDEAGGTPENALTDRGARKVRSPRENGSGEGLRRRGPSLQAPLPADGWSRVCDDLCAPTLPDLNERAVFYFRESVHRHGRLRHRQQQWRYIMKRIIRAGAGSLLLLLAAGPAFAHHPFASEFDAQAPV